MAEICMYNPDMFIWIDETGSDRRKEIRKYGYSLRGIPPCISAIPVMTTRGIEDVKTTTGNVNGEEFTFHLQMCFYALQWNEPKIYYNYWSRS